MRSPTTTQSQDPLSSDLAWTNWQAKGGVGERPYGDDRRLAMCEPLCKGALRRP